MADTTIEWTQVTWNPTTGCDRVSPGCDQCYAMRLAPRLKAMEQCRGTAHPKYQRDGDPRTSGPGFGVSLHEDVLTVPLRWRKPSRVFVDSMSDFSGGFRVDLAENVSRFRRSIDTNATGIRPRQVSGIEGSAA